MRIAQYDTEHIDMSFSHLDVALICTPIHFLHSPKGLLHIFNQNTGFKTQNNHDFIVISTPHTNLSLICLKAVYTELEQVAWDLKVAQTEAGVDFPVHLSREAGGMVRLDNNQYAPLKSIHYVCM